MGGGERAGRLLGRRCRSGAAVASASGAKGPVPPEHVPTILAALRALRLPADDGRAVRPRRRRGVGGGLRADRQPQRRRAALAREPGRRSSTAARGLLAARRRGRARDEAPAPQQRAVVAVGLRPAGGAVRAAARASTPTSAISAFHGLANAPLNVAGLTIYPGQRRRAGATTSCRPHAERHFGSLRGGLVAQPGRRLRARPGDLARAERRLLGAGRPRPGAAGGARLLRRDRRGADRDDALRAGAAAPLRPALRPARRRHRRLSRRSRGPSARRSGSRATRSSSASSPSTRARPRASRWPR